MTVRRAVSLGILVAVLLGTATGLSHVGHTSVSKCTGTWRVVVGTSTDSSASPTQNSRAIGLVPALCTGSAKNAKGNYEAFALFDTEQEAQAYAQQLVAAGYAKQWGFEPYVEQPPASTNTIP